MGQLPFTFHPSRRETEPREEQAEARANASPDARTRAPASRGGREIVTVGQLVQDLAGLFATAPQVWVRGEVSRWRRQTGGQAYFALKDAQGRLDCVMWRDHARRLRFEPKDGAEVLCLAKPGVYPKQGRLQLTVVSIDPVGRGALQARYEACVERLRAEGLTSGDRKRPLPALPGRIGIVTSQEASALHDALRTIWRRDPSAHVVLSPAPVQGARAHLAIAGALRRLERHGCDVILLVRGGGSLEDLWSFNEESLARAVAGCAIPVVTGVGHETDTTLCDLVADVRASTPTGAAEVAVPLRAAVSQHLERLEHRLQRALARHVQGARVRLQKAEAGVRSPEARLHQQRQRVDGALEQAAARARKTAREGEAELRALERRLAGLQPQPARTRPRISGLEHRLQRAVEARVQRASRRLGIAASKLEASSPLATLARGYAIVQNERGQLVRSASALTTGEGITVRLQRGQVQARVTATHPEEDS